MSDDNLLELLEMYIEMTERQDEIIHKLSVVVARQATELAHLRNMMRADTLENDIQKGGK